MAGAGGQRGEGVPSAGSLGKEGVLALGSLGTRVWGVPRAQGTPKCRAQS